MDESISAQKCVAVFEFVTNEVCKLKKPLDPEMPCSLYGDDHQLRDLTPLIKLKGKKYNKTMFFTVFLQPPCQNCRVAFDLKDNLRNYTWLHVI